MEFAGNATRERRVAAQVNWRHGYPAWRAVNAAAENSGARGAVTRRCPGPATRTGSLQCAEPEPCLIRFHYAPGTDPSATLTRSADEFMSGRGRGILGRRMSASRLAKT